LDVNDKTPARKKNTPAPVDVSHEEVEGLKRDMQTARLLAWVQENQRALAIAAVAVLIIIIGAGLWRERISSQHEAAAVLYHQALATSAQDKKVNLLNTVVRDYNSTAYAVLARMLLARADRAHATAHLQALLERHDLTPEIAAQSRLDLAELKLEQGDKPAVRTLLSESAGTHYEQLRLYLLARAADSDSSKRDYLQKALAAVSHDETLKKDIERRLNAMGSGSNLSR